MEIIEKIATRSTHQDRLPVAKFPQRSHAGIVFTVKTIPATFYSLAQKWVYTFGTANSDKRESWQGERTCSPLLRANFHVYRCKNVGIQPPKLSKFRIFAINLYLIVEPTL